MPRRSTSITKRDAASSLESDVSTSTNTDLGMVMSMAVQHNQDPLTTFRASESIPVLLPHLYTMTPTASFSDVATGIASSTLATSPSPAPTEASTTGSSEAKNQTLAESSRNSVSQSTNQSATSYSGPDCTPQPGGGPICHYGPDSAEVQSYHPDEHGPVIIGSFIAVFFLSIALVFLVWWWIKRRSVALSAAAIAVRSKFMELPELRSIKSGEGKKETGGWIDLPDFQGRG